MVKMSLSRQKNCLEDNLDSKRSSFEPRKQTDFLNETFTMVNEEQASTVTQSNTLGSAKVINSPAKFYRSWTHKLVSPDVYESKSQNTDKQRTIKQLSTWRGQQPVENDFRSVAQASYLNPKDQPKTREFHLRDPYEIAKESAIKEEQHKALERFCNMTKTRYGTTSSMLKAVRLIL